MIKNIVLDQSSGSKSVLRLWNFKPKWVLTLGRDAAFLSVVLNVW